jgi:transposase InsO family protein
VKVLRSDNGGEFANKVLANFLTSRGIRAERSLPYHHYQNGVLERFNRTVLEMGRTVLGDSKLPQRFWVFAFEWASWTLNRLVATKHLMKHFLARSHRWIKLEYLEV